MWFLKEHEIMRRIPSTKSVPICDETFILFLAAITFCTFKSAINLVAYNKIGQLVSLSCGMNQPLVRGWTDWVRQE